MKFIHLSDLHLGKRVNAFSMIDDQKDIVKKILKVIKEEKPDAVLIPFHHKAPIFRVILPKAA